MVPSDRALATFYRLSIITMSPSAAVWPQFSMEDFKIYKWPYLENGERYSQGYYSSVWHIGFQMA